MKHRLDVVLFVVLPIVLFAAVGLWVEKAFARGDVDFRQLEYDVVEELNNARTNPRSYAAHLQELRRYFYGKELRLPGRIPVRTKEGVAAVIEAIRFLEKSTSLPSLKRSQGLSRAAPDHVELQGKGGATGHGTTGGTWLLDRVNKYGTWEKAIGENIAYGPPWARDIVTSLIVDDGVRGRGHRQNIFNGTFRVVGIGCGPHATYGTMCVIIFAGDYREKEE